MNPSLTISINSHPKILRVDNKMDSLCNSSVDIWTVNYLQSSKIYIVKEGRFAIDARIKKLRRLSYVKKQAKG